MIIFNSDLEDDISKNVGWLFFNSDLEDDISKSVGWLFFNSDLEDDISKSVLDGYFLIVISRMTLPPYRTYRDPCRQVYSWLSEIKEKFIYYHKCNWQSF